MWATTLYCEPKRGLFRKPDDQATGLYIKLAQFGFGKKESPALETRIARQCALCPSFELARDELKREGLKLSTKAVRRVAQQCGEDLLKLRTLQLQQWRAGTLTSTNADIHERSGRSVCHRADRRRSHQDSRRTPKSHAGA